MVAENPMKFLVNNFLKGILVLFPIVASVYAVVWVLYRLDQFLPLPYPGLGLVFVIAFVTLVGFMASNVVGRRLVRVVEATFERVPVVRVLYTAFRDLVGAFLGEKRAFDKPVVVMLSADVRALGFVTCEAFDEPELGGMVAVYLPMAYNWCGNLLVVPRERVSPIAVESAPFLAFIASGGVSLWE
jgi:uncharacterized membrane protein